MCLSRRDFGWLLAIAALVLLAIVTFWLGGKGNEIVSYMSFASSLASIALALVAIFYSIVQNVSSQQNIGEMKTLVSEASRIITEKAESMEKVFRAQQKAVELSGPPPGKTEPKGIPVLFHLLQTSDLTRLFAYFLLRSYKVRAEFSIEQFVGIAKPLVKMTEAQLSSYTYGILHGLSCCLTGYLTIEDQTRVQLVKLPDDFETYVLVMLEWMKERNPALTGVIERIDGLTAACSKQG